MRNIVPVIDGDMFHNYVYMCKQLFLCDIIGSHYSDQHLFHKFLTFL